MLKQTKKNLQLQKLQKLIVDVVVAIIILAIKREAVLHPCLAVQSFTCVLL